MSAHPSTLLLDGECITIPAGAEGRALLDGLVYQVPRRNDDRRAAHRERFCIIALAKTLQRTDADSFPACLRKGESPDFALTFCSGHTIAIEHTDAGEPKYQQHLAETEGIGEPVFVPSPNGDGWIGDAPERAFCAALKAALARKLSPAPWKNAPVSAERWLLMYDQTNTGMFVRDEVALGILKAAACKDMPWAGAYSRIYLVRSQDVVLCWSQQEGAE